LLNSEFNFKVGFFILYYFLLNIPPDFNKSIELSAFPVPAATQDKGSSATITIIPVLSSILLSKPYNNDPPPVIIIPLLLISAASSGGVFSSTSCVVITICSAHSSSASNISEDDTVIA